MHKKSKKIIIKTDKNLKYRNNKLKIKKKIIQFQSNNKNNN